MTNLMHMLLVGLRLVVLKSILSIGCVGPVEFLFDTSSEASKLLMSFIPIFFVTKVSWFLTPYMVH